MTDFRTAACGWLPGLLLGLQVAVCASCSGGPLGKFERTSPLAFEIAWISAEEGDPLNLDIHDYRNWSKPVYPGVKVVPRVAAAAYLLGVTVAQLADVNLDGVSDILVGRGVFGHGYEGGITIFSGADGTLLAIQGHLVHYDALGAALSDVGDLDGDGVSDYGAGAPSSMADEGGFVVLYSGRSHERLRILGGNNPKGDLFGASLASIGDVDGDGITDLAVGAPNDAFDTGRVSAFSGADGQELWTLWDPNGIDGLGLSIRFCAGHGLLVRRPDDVLILSPADGHVIKTIPSPREASNVFPFDVFSGRNSMACLGDLNQDGVHDVVLASPRFPEDSQLGRQPPEANLCIIDGRDGGVIRRIVEREGGDRFAELVETVADMDGDSLPDLITAVWAAGASQLVWISSGSGKTLARVPAPPDDNFFGRSLCSMGDLNGDNVDEVVVTGHTRWDNGRVYLLRSVNGGKLTSACSGRSAARPATEWSVPTSVARSVSRPAGLP